jgi:hypothetical protein
LENLETHRTLSDRTISPLAKSAQVAQGRAPRPSIERLRHKMRINRVRNDLRVITAKAQKARCDKPLHAEIAHVATSSAGRRMTTFYHQRFGHPGQSSANTSQSVLTRNLRGAWPDHRCPTGLAAAFFGSDAAVIGRPGGLGVDPRRAGRPATTPALMRLD